MLIGGYINLPTGDVGGSLSWDNPSYLQFSFGYKYNGDQVIITAKQLEQVPTKF